eukprot:SAG11_NODE_27203_length_335_cov_1.271186_1_plen_36_part_10
MAIFPGATRKLSELSGIRDGLFSTRAQILDVLFPST